MLAGLEVTGDKAAGVVALLGIIVLGGAVGVSVFGQYRRVLAHGYVDVRNKVALREMWMPQFSKEGLAAHDRQPVGDKANGQIDFTWDGTQPKCYMVMNDQWYSDADGSECESRLGAWRSCPGASCAGGYLDTRKLREPNRTPPQCFSPKGEPRACDAQDARFILHGAWGVLPGGSLTVEVPQCADKTMLHLWLRQTSAGPHRIELCENDAHQLVEIETNPPRATR